MKVFSREKYLESEDDFELEEYYLREKELNSEGKKSWVQQCEGLTEKQMRPYYTMDYWMVEREEE